MLVLVVVVVVGVGFGLVGDVGLVWPLLCRQ
jgi:hypothetical protein